MLLAEYHKEVINWYTISCAEKRAVSIPIIQEIQNRLHLTFMTESELRGNVCMANNPEVRDEFREVFVPQDVLDFILAHVHSSTYPKTTRKIFSKNLSQIPCPKNAESFWKLVRLGERLRRLNLLDFPLGESAPINYPLNGSDRIPAEIRIGRWEQIILKHPLSAGAANGRIWINEKHYFDNIPLSVWHYGIYRKKVLQQWLVDRKGQILELDDKLYFQKMISTIKGILGLVEEIDRLRMR